MGIFFDLTVTLNTLNTSLLWLVMLIFCFSSILLFLKIFGYVGLYVYSSIAVIAGNIQVLKTVDFFYSHEPVALGTLLFASTFLCTDILSEHYGKEKAQTYTTLIDKKRLTFVFVGLEANNGFLPDDMQRDANGFVETDGSFATSMEGVYAVGAVRSGYSGQLASAAGEAASVVAGLSI